MSIGPAVRIVMNGSSSLAKPTMQMDVEIESAQFLPGRVGSDLLAQIQSPIQFGSSLLIPHAGIGDGRMTTRRGPIDTKYVNASHQRVWWAQRIEKGVILAFAHYLGAQRSTRCKL